MGINSTNAAYVQGTITAPTIVQTVNTQSVTSYTAVSSDAASVVLMDSSNSNTFFIPTNASVPFAIGASLNVVSYNTGLTTIQAATTSTTTILCAGAGRQTPTNPMLRQRYSAATCLKVATDTWIVIGDVY